MDLMEDSVSIVEDPTKEVVKREPAKNNSKSGTKSTSKKKTATASKSKAVANTARKTTKPAKSEETKLASGETKEEIKEVEVSEPATANEAQAKPAETPNEEVKVRQVQGSIEVTESTNPEKRKKTKGEKITLGISIALLVLMVPMLLVNIVLIFSALTNPNDVPNFFGLKPMIVLSPSMEPMIMTNDLIIDKPVNDLSTLKEGDVISYREKKADGSLGAVVTHKIASIALEADGTYKIVTTGINNIMRDSNGNAVKNSNGENVTYQDEPITGDQVIGIYVTRIPGFGGVMYWMQSVWGIIVCIGIPALAFIIYELVKRNNELRSQRKSNSSKDDELEELRRKLAELEGKK